MALQILDDHLRSTAVNRRLCSGSRLIERKTGKRVDFLAIVNNKQTVERSPLAELQGVIDAVRTAGLLQQHHGEDGKSYWSNRIGEMQARALPLPTLLSTSLYRSHDDLLDDFELRYC